MAHSDPVTGLCFRIQAPWWGPSCQSINNPMAERTTITLRLTPEERADLEILKAYLLERNASRALRTTMRLYPSQHQSLQDTLDKLDEAWNDRQRLLHAINTAEQAMLNLIRVASEIASEDWMNIYQNRKR